MAKRTVVIGLVQMAMSEDQQKNLTHAAKLVERAAKKGADIICLPELYRTPYFPQRRRAKKERYAESIPGPSTRMFSTLAKKHGVVLVVPIYEKTKRGHFHNAAVVINERGRLLPTYRKTHIPQDPLFYEKDYFEEGDMGYRVYNTKRARIAVLICYDQWFPEAAREAALKGAEIIFYPTAIGRISGDTQRDGNWLAAWETVMRGHAIANATHVATVNRVGKEGRLRFWGRSFISDGFGTVLRRASATKEEILVVKADLGHNKHVRERWGFFRNRRPETYTLSRRKFMRP